ncbi:flavin reductase [Ensifer sp. ENS05]|uniref:flavin reductase family protein n=1 Tax=Ensifer sp. ENS05 TaxID=2769277 RepID=UPI00177AE6A7|nr:flavin reductase family protein [Ensifer sp. ENS05]MBD9597396.1 flavin reductase [Ensifer sp. ENS05]
MRNLIAGVTVVTTAAGRKATGMTATSVSSLSASPPSLLVCANQSGSFAALIKEGRPFCVNVLSSSHVELAKTFGSADANKNFDGPEWLRDHDDVPYLVEAKVRFHCKAFQIFPVATHLIVAGTVEEVEFAASSLKALAYSDGRFTTVA